MNYQKHYNLLIERAKNRSLLGYGEWHHIIPKCLNGEDISDNLVHLTPEEHFVAHQLLIKIYPLEPKLVYAARMMTQENKKRSRRNNKMYGWLKRKHSEAKKTYRHSEEVRKKLSESHKGKISPKKGKTLEEIHGFEKAKEIRLKCGSKNKGKPSPRLGVKLSEETKQKISKANLGKVVSEEAKKKNSKSHSGMNNHFYGKKHTAESRQKISEAKRNISKETRLKMSMARKGKSPWNKGLKLKEK
jgi:hypothetical protein